MAVELAYDGTAKLKKFLEYASGNMTAGVPPSQRQKLLNHVFCVADDFVSKLEQSSLPFRTYDWQFASFTDSILTLLPKGAERVTSIAEAWAEGLALSAMVRCLNLWKELHESYEAGNLSTTTYFDSGELDALGKALLDRIITASKNGSLSKTPLLNFVLYFWDQIEAGAGSRFASQLSVGDVGFADLAVGALRPRPPMAANPVDRSDVALLERWVAIKALDLPERCEKILAQRPDWLSEIQAISLRAIIDEVRNPRDNFGRPVRRAT
jgi:hypothetical protein